MIIGLTIFAKPDIATLVCLFVLYTNAGVVAVHFHGVPQYAAAAVPAMLVIPLIYYVILNHREIIVTPELPLIFLLLAVQVVGVLFASNIGRSFTAMQGFAVEGLGLYFLVTNAVRSQVMLRRAVWVLLLAGAFMGGLTFYQQITGTFDNNYGGFAQVGGSSFETGAETISGVETQPYLVGPIGEKNRYAQTMLMLVPLGLFRIWGERAGALRGLAAVATGFTTLGMMLTFSRGAAVGFGVVLFIMMMMRYIKWWHLLVVALGLVLLLQLVPSYRTRLMTLEGVASLASEDTSGADSSLQSRLTENVAALLVFVDHPIVGVGPGLFRAHYREYAELVGVRVHTTERQAHNLYLGLAAETGLLGLVSFLAIVTVTLRGLGRARRPLVHTNPELAYILTGFLLAISSYLVTGIFLHFAFIRFFWLMLGLASAAVYIANKGDEETNLLMEAPQDRAWPWIGEASGSPRQRVAPQEHA
jgi:O-antigen ligase